MKGSFTRYKILTWLLIFFSFNTFDIPFFWLPLFLMKCQSLILFIAPKCFVFSLGLVIVLAFNTLIVMDLCMISFVFSYMRFVKFLGSESYCSVANWRCSWPLFLQVFFCPFLFFFSFWDSTFTYCGMLDIVPHISEILSFFFNLFWSDENILELDCGDGTTLWMS